MKTFFKFLLYLTLGIILLSTLTELVIYGCLIYLAYLIVKKIVLFIKKENAMKKLTEATKEHTDTIEYKMMNLLKLSGNNSESPSVRHSYLVKTDLTLQDQWYQFVDLRAKLELNNTSTANVEAVLHLMCDELTSRLQTVDVEVTDRVKKEFIEDNLAPLMNDINEILSGIKPSDAIDIDAYDLLKNSSLIKLG